jgi:hypothetical protein
MSVAKAIAHAREMGFTVELDNKNITGRYGSLGFVITYGGEVLSAVPIFPRAVAFTCCSIIKAGQPAPVPAEHKCRRCYGLCEPDRLLCIHCRGMDPEVVR